MLIAPVEAPKHNTSVWEVLATATAEPDCVMVTVRGAEVHPLESFTVTVYVPAISPVLSSGSVVPVRSAQS
ncbi:hypothetical protein D3C85_1635800 [compost metagenome]